VLFINDIHIAPNRTGGTTPVTQAMLLEYVHESFEHLLDIPTTDGCVLIGGDLHDGFQIPNAALLRVYSAICARLESGAIRTLFMSRGNHDLAKDTAKLSSFDLLAALLADAYPQRVVVITEPTLIAWSEHEADQGWVVPHAPNNDIHDLWIEQVRSDPTPFVFLHCNYDNGMAAQTDHSLNITKEQCAALEAAGVKRIIFAHEHVQNTHPNGVLIVGNQFPCSVSDCLNNTYKRALQIEAGRISEVVTWTDKGSYFECDWTKLDQIPETAQFVRVKGEATDEQAAAVMEAISTLRKKHSAFVVTNAVIVNGRALDVSALEAVEQVQQFDVTEFLFDNLSADQVEYLRPMLKERV
jgi:UDP-2,3-diacylglucosamine pyrophosphatase LpxH